MSSFTRRIERQLTAIPAHQVAGTLCGGEARGAHFMGRGSKLGVSNPKDPCRTAGPKKAPKPWRAAHKATDPKPKLPRSAVAQPRAVVLSKDAQRELHKMRMIMRVRKYVASRRASALPGFPASINRHTGKPHLHIAEITRRGGTPPVVPAKPKRRRRAA